VYDDPSGGVPPLEERIKAAEELLEPRLALIAVEAKCREEGDDECEEARSLGAGVDGSVPPWECCTVHLGGGASAAPVDRSTPESCCLWKPVALVELSVTHHGGGRVPAEAGPQVPVGRR
jgi:hypothetical protein